MANLDNINATGVKFYSSLTRNQAKGIDPVESSTYTKVLSTNSRLDDDSIIYYREVSCQTVETTPSWNGSNIYYYKKYFVEPGAICFVSDAEGNSIFLNSYLFGDGAKAGSGGSAITEVNLSDLQVTVNKTLADYFNNLGSFITDSLIIEGYYTENGENKTKQIEIKAGKDGLTVGGSLVATQTYVNNKAASVLSDAKGYSDENLESAKSYADSLLTTVYVVKGTVQTYNDLPKDAKNGWVYNVANAYGNIPAGTNYVYVVPETGSPYWDALGGSIDLSIYATKSDLSNLEGTIDNKISTAIQTEVYNLSQLISNYNSEVQEIKTKLGAFETTVGNILTTQNTNSQNISTNTTNIAINTANISTNTTNISNLSTQLTWQ